MLIKKLEPDFIFADDRGTLTQILHDDINQVNAVFTKKNAVRGNWHYHKYCKEYFYIIKGSVTVKARLDDCEEEQNFGSGAMFFIPENVRHYFEYNEDTYMVVIYNKRVELDDNTKDIFTD